MKELWIKIRDNIGYRYLLAAVAGLLLAAAFPKPSIAGYAWIAPALLLLAVFQLDDFAVLRVGYFGGLVTALAQFYWLLLIPVKGYPIMGWIALSAYLALFPALWVWCLAGKIGEGGWLQRVRWSLAGAALWVALEMLRARLLGGMPWNLLGDSQYKLTPLIQIAGFTGVYGVSFLVIWFSLSLYSAVRMLLRDPSQRFAWQGEMFFPLLAVIALYDYGLTREHSPAAPPPTVSVTFIQPSIPQTLIWDQNSDAARFQQLLAQTRDALTNNRTDLVIWPEAAMPDIGQAQFAQLTDLIRAQKVWMIFGADDATQRADARPGEMDYFNASFLFNPNGDMNAVYHKRKLVLFGEFVPRLLSRFTPITGSYTPGKDPVPFRMLIDKRGVTTSTFICFEDIFPHIVREYAGPDTDFLVNISNDGWFGQGAAQWQQAGAAVFRAVENNLPLLRCCNNGLTCWIDKYGRIRQIFTDDTGSIYGPGVMTAKIPTLFPGVKHEPTFYELNGDVFGWICVAFGGIVLWKRLPKPKRRKWGDF